MEAGLVLFRPDGPPPGDSERPIVLWREATGAPASAVAVLDSGARIVGARGQTLLVRARRAQRLRREAARWP